MYFQISKKEQLKADMTSLLALCEKADNDIRSCLNTLQVSLQGFLKTASNTVSLLSSVLHESLLPIFFFTFSSSKGGYGKCLFIQFSHSVLDRKMLTKVYSQFGKVFLKCLNH